MILNRLRIIRRLAAPMLYSVLFVVAPSGAGRAETGASSNHPQSVSAPQGWMPKGNTTNVLPSIAPPPIDSTTYVNQPATSDYQTGDLPSPSDYAGSATRVLGAFVVILILILTLAYLFKRFGFRHHRATSHVQIRVVGSISLGPKRGIWVVEILGRILVIGITEQNLSLLTEIDDATALEPANGTSEQDQNIALRFGDLLNGWLGARKTVNNKNIPNG